jgi:hypothetical protein
LANEIRPDTEGFLKLTTEGIEKDFAQDLSQAEKELLIATQGPTADAALGTPASKPAWRNKRSWFVIASCDRAVSPQLEATEATRMRAVTITIPTSHLAMLADPERVAGFIRLAAWKTGER